ncbi:MAG: phenylalanine--tRNA ligase subunit beta [Fibromonadaceae bacterium]|jgi:phenylalanyl-tRNA synthetase beta chain|nr:phenylalanine--tRNA ligase subunit beta [Fibromonadaceae bacterium]
MKLSMDWIKDYVKIPENLELSRIAYDLTMSTVEVEGITELSKNFSNIIVGLVNEVLPHPNADKLRICKTDIGGGQIKEIVCGGSNLNAGMKVAVACPGAMVRWHGAGEPVEIKISKLRGVESYGMICASSEIGLADLFPTTEEATIVDLSAFDAAAGTNLAEALDLNDVILEIDNKSLTNRPDLWGHYGIAREISALYNLPLKEFAPFTPQSVPDLEITLEDTQRSPRYIGVKIEGLSIKPSPFKIQSRIWRVGMHPINAIVDITNYVMLAIGQPTHAFDSDNIEGHITVRRAQESEKLLLLNGKELSLSANDLVIADNEAPVGLAGVMGGSKDSVLPKTTKVILEIANFDSKGIRHTAMRYEVRTEAAIRYEKGIDPERCDIALSLAMQMFADFFSGISITGFRDSYPEHLKSKEIDVSLDWLEKRLGKHIPNDDIACKLEHLGFKVNFDKNNMHVTVPTWRSTGDISIPDDIMEEVARLHGYENFEPTLITTTFNGAINQLDIDIDRKSREYLACRCGMQEIFTYPWMTDEYVNALFPSNKDMLSLSMPPSPNEHYIRSSLLPNLCKAIEGNLRFFNEFAIFESAQVFSNRDFKAVYDKRESLPHERRNIAGAFVGDTGDVNSLFRKAKGIINYLPRCVHIEPITFEKIEKPIWSDGVVWLNLCHGGERIGNLALLSKKASLDCGIKNSAVIIFEIDIDSLKPYPSRTNKFVHLPEYPITEYDISMLFDLSVKWEDIRGVIAGKGGSEDLLRDISFVDEYRGHQVPEGKKSVTIRLVIGSFKKTLTSEEIEGYAKTVMKKLQKNFGAELRN